MWLALSQVASQGVLLSMIIIIFKNFFSNDDAIGIHDAIIPEFNLDILVQSGRHSVYYFLWRTQEFDIGNAHAENFI